MRPYSLSDPAVLAFAVIPMALLALFACGIAAAWRRAGERTEAARRAGLLAAAAGAGWMAITWLAAASGALRGWDRTPPTFAFLVLGVFALAGAISVSRAGARLALLPLWMLVGVQAFRLPLEIAMHAMYERGIMPEVMSYSGRNFDIVTGATAMVVAVLLAAGRAGRRLALAWNVLGTALLANVVVVAVLATPVFEYFGDDQLNVWVTYPPFVWLPAVMVLAALAGHVVVFQSLLRS